jgi:DNA-binding NtrC family response regulator
MNYQARILLIDRHSKWLDFAVKTLQEVGYEVHSASDFVKAAECFVNNSFDLILIGLDQAENSLDEIEHLAKDKLHSKRFVVMFPIRQTYDRVRIMFKAGAYDVVDKPYQPKELREMVSTQLVESISRNQQQ